MFRRFAFWFSSGSVLVSQNFLQATYRGTIHVPARRSWMPRDGRATPRRPRLSPSQPVRASIAKQGDAAISDVGSELQRRTPARLPGVQSTVARHRARTREIRCAATIHQRDTERPEREAVAGEERADRRQERDDDKGAAEVATTIPVSARALASFCRPEPGVSTIGATVASARRTSSAVRVG